MSVVTCFGFDREVSQLKCFDQLEGKFRFNYLKSGFNKQEVSNSKLFLYHCSSKDNNNLSAIKSLNGIFPAVPLVVLCLEVDEWLITWALRNRLWDCIVLPDEQEHLHKVVEELCAKKNLENHDVLSPCNLMQFSSNIFRSDASHKTKQAVDYLHQHYCRKVRIDELANICRMGRGTFSRKFKEELGCTVREYLKHLRIDAATKLLHHSDKSVETISYEVGFEIISLFNRLFKQIAGCSPKEYRHKNCNG